MEGFIRELKKTQFTFITGVNTLFNALLNTPGFAELDFSTLKGALGVDKVHLPDMPEFISALGAALIAAEGKA
jgi:hypothetical protein